MAELPAMYHDAYSFAVREWKALGLSDHPSDAELTTLTGLVRRYINRLYPNVTATARASAVSYGVDSAERDLISPDVPGFPGFVGSVVGSVGDAIEGDVAAVQAAAGAAVHGLEAAASAVLAQIVRAVDLPRSALPAKVPVNIAGAYTTLARELGHTTPTRLAAANKTRASLRRLGR